MLCGYTAHKMVDGFHITEIWQLRRLENPKAEIADILYLQELSPLSLSHEFYELNEFYQSK